MLLSSTAKVIFLSLPEVEDRNEQEEDRLLVCGQRESHTRSAAASQLLPNNDKCVYHRGFDELSETVVFFQRKITISPFKMHTRYLRLPCS